MESPNANALGYEMLGRVQLSHRPDRAIGEVEKIIDYVKQGKIDDFEII